MKIAVTDACIFIDLIELEILSEFFELDIEIHTSVEVVNELFPNQKHILKAYESANLLVVHNLREADFNQMSEINFPKGLSQEEKSVIYLAFKLGSAIVIRW